MGPGSDAREGGLPAVLRFLKCPRLFFFCISCWDDAYAACFLRQNLFLTLLIPSIPKTVIWTKTDKATKPAKPKIFIKTNHEDGSGGLEEHMKS